MSITTNTRIARLYADALLRTATARTRRQRTRADRRRARLLSIARAVKP